MCKTPIPNHAEEQISTVTYVWLFVRPVKNDYYQ